MKKRAIQQLGLGAGGFLVVALFFLIVSNALTVGHNSRIIGIAFGMLLIAVFLIGIVLERMVMAAVIRRILGMLENGNTTEAWHFIKDSDFSELAPAWEQLFGRMQQLSTEAEREESTDKALLASIGEGVIATDIEGRIIVVNKAAGDMLGLETKEAVGRRTVDVIPMEDDQGQVVIPEKRTIQLALASGEKVTVSHYVFIRKDKSKFPVIITATPVKFQGKVIGGIVVFRDISREKEIDQAKTEFVSLASHQLRTPLTAINWYIEMLMSGDAGPVTDEQKSFLQEIFKGSNRMIHIVNEFLNVARLESGRLKIDPKPLQLIDFIQEIIDEVSPLAKARNCSIIFNKPPELPPLISLDGLLMRQVIHNLLTNALRYSPEGKCVITVSLRRGENDNYVVSVKDNGIGIPKELQSRIFEKFFRTENAVQAATEGSGIGLYISKMIVEASNAKIWFESEENKGTTFYVSIPLKGSAQRKDGRELIPL